MASVKTIIRPVDKGCLRSNIPFLNSDPDAFSTHHQEDFKPFSIERTKPFSEPMAAEVDHKDLKYINENLTEMMTSYQPYTVPPVTCVPRWIKLKTNFKMHADPGHIAFLTTQTQDDLRPRPFQLPPLPFRPSSGYKKPEQVEKLPQSSCQASFIPHHVSPVVKATTEHLEEGSAAIRVDERQRNLVSHYSTMFQGAQGRPAQSLKKHTSSVVMGDPVKIVEKETTHDVSFNWPTARSPPVVKKGLKFNLGNFPQDSWSPTTREDFRYEKPGSPVVLTKGIRNLSSLPEGDTDPECNKDWMSVTTNKIFFPLHHTTPPVHLPKSDLITKSHVQFSSPHLSGLYYTTTGKEDYSKKDAVRPRTIVQQPSNTLKGPEHGPNLSTIMADYVPRKICRPVPFLPPEKTSIRFPITHQHFSTTHSEEYSAKPLVLKEPSNNQFRSHFVIH